MDVELTFVQFLTLKIKQGEGVLEPGLTNHIQ